MDRQPAAGGSIANILSYDFAKKVYKTLEEFGKGKIDSLLQSQQIIHP